MSAVEYRNPEGKSRWQPTLANGERLWGTILWGEYDGKRWALGDVAHADSQFPILYRSRLRAHRVARRERRRRERDRVNTYREVKP